MLKILQKTINYASFIKIKILKVNVKPSNFNLTKQYFANITFIFLSDQYLCLFFQINGFQHVKLTPKSLKIQIFSLTQYKIKIKFLINS